MRTVTRMASAAAIATAAVAAFAVPAASAATSHRTNGAFHGHAADAVFVQTDNLAGNTIVAYRRAPDGTLTQTGQYPTGGLGAALTGSVVDHLASQGSLGYDAASGTLIAVNAGSNTVSVFGARGDRLHLRQVIGSGGTFPVSVAIHHGLVYVLNARDGGSLQGYRLLFGRAFPLPGSARTLGLDPTAQPEFVNTPGQVAFSPDGSQLVVTTKANGNDIDVLAVRPDGRLGAAVVNSEPGTVPFAISFDSAGHLVIANAGTNALATFALSPSGTVTLLDAVGTGAAATCWVAPAAGYFFASNAGSATISGYSVDSGANLTLLGTTGTDPGTVDASAAPGGQFLYVQTGGNGIVDEFSVGAGTLAPIGSVTVPGAVGGEGIVAA